MVRSSSPSVSPPLTALNFLNVLAYIANLLVTYGIGVAGFAGTQTNADLSAKYQTLVTPIGWAFAIWGVIFLAQLVFTIAQLLGAYRQAPLVTPGVGRGYIGVCIAQVGWTLAFTYEIIWLSLVFMLSILYFLISILMSQYKTQQATSVKDYWLLKFPFAIHAGWIVAASFVNIGVVLVNYSVGETIQYYFAFATIVMLLLITAVALGYHDRPEYVVPLVLSWASLGIYFELSNPKDSIVATFGANKVNDVKYGAIIASVTIFVAVLVRALMNYRKKHGGGEADSEENAYLRHEEHSTRR